MVRQLLIAAAVAVVAVTSLAPGLGTDRDWRPSAHDRASSVMAADPRLRPAQRALLCDSLPSCCAGRSLLTPASPRQDIGKAPRSPRGSFRARAEPDNLLGIGSGRRCQSCDRSALRVI